MEEDKVMEEEEEEEDKEHFFADIVPSERRGSDEEEDEDEDHHSEPQTGPASVGPASSGAESMSMTPAGTAQIGASPYITPFTPLMSSPSRPKTPSSVSLLQRTGAKKPQLVPVKQGASFASTARAVPDDIVGHLPDELVDALTRTVQTLDQLILGVEDFKAEQLGFLAEKVNAYVELLRKVDAAGANYRAQIPLHVLQMLDAPDASNPELFTKQQLEKCRDESERAASKVATLQALKTELESGLGGESS